MRLTVRAGCKVNLHLAITGVRENGYHELETLFYPVPEPHDTLEFAWDEDAGVPGPDGRAGTPVAPGLRLWCSLPELETPSNIVAKAYDRFAGRTGYRPDLAVFLTKGIPHGAGLGGGSADAAAMLDFLNAQAGDKALGGPELSALAVKLGADVPFFLMNRPAWATGIGEELTATDADLSGLTLLVVMPEERVNTAWAYRAWDDSFFTAKQEGRGMLLTRSCPASMRPFCVSGAFIANSFEGVVFRQYPAIRRLKERLLALGASAAGMSGSGSAVFALFKDSAKADAAATAFGPSAAFLSALS